MCYYYSLAEDAIKVQKRFKAKILEEERYVPFEKVSTFEDKEVPVVVKAESNIIQFFKWGLIPSWTPSLTAQKKMGAHNANARAETIFEKKSFSKIILSRRCLVPATGFYEWQHLWNEKIPYLIKLKDEEIFGLGGVWDQWVNAETGEIFNTFTIITTIANPLLEVIHNTKKRMPLIIDKKDEDMWLDYSLTREQIKSLLKPYPDDKMEAIQLRNDAIGIQGFESL